MRVVSSIDMLDLYLYLGWLGFLGLVKKSGPEPVKCEISKRNSVGSEIERTQFLTFSSGYDPFTDFSDP